MKYYYLLFFLLPLFANGQNQQPVLPIESKDYAEQLKAYQQKQSNPAGTDNPFAEKLEIKNGPLDRYDLNKMVNIKIRKGKAVLLSPKDRKVFFSGEYSSTLTYRTVNQLPSLQNSFVQGRGINGNLVWQGPETNEPFSYGPLVSDLQYDGVAYPFDNRGKLVPKSNGVSASPIDNGLFAPVWGNKQSITLKAGINLEGPNKLGYTMSFVRNKENSIFPNNNNTGNELSASAKASLGDWEFNMLYKGNWNRFSIGNRNGLLNWAYANASLAPISFDVNQALLLTNGQQRTYQAKADNPRFLLSANNNGFQKRQSVVGISTEYSGMKFCKINIDQSLETDYRFYQENYASKSANFPNRIIANRTQNDLDYMLKLSAKHRLSLLKYIAEHSVNVSTITNVSKSTIDYHLQTPYRYDRTYSNSQFSYLQRFYIPRHTNWEVSSTLGNQTYLSSTSSQSVFWLPNMSTELKKDRLFGMYYLEGKISLAHTQSVLESPLNRSLAAASLFGLSAADAMQYFPTKEALGFSNLLPIRVRENKIDFALEYNNDRINWEFSSNYFWKYSKDDVLPLLANGNIQLANLADHKTRGFEINLGHGYTKEYYVRRKNYYSIFSIKNRVSLFHYSNKVTKLANGLGEEKVAGFSDVYKALIPGQPIGVIMGSTYLRNPNNQVVIDADGFPIVNPNPTIIGNPNPDFSLKTNSTMQLRTFSFEMDWEWKKGGDVWNGTQAALDYYGRSATSANQRGIFNYVFEGVDAQGVQNRKAVSFYNPNLPIAQNRWVRYGPSGVAEANVQDGSYIKLHTLRFGYFLRLPSRLYFDGLQINLSAQNLLVWSPYTGVDPSQTLLDLPNAQGLDYFNVPSSKLFLLQLSLNF